MAAESGLFDSLAHPDIVKIVFPSRWDVNTLMDHICTSLDRIAVTGVAMELNTSGLNKPLAEMNPGQAILIEMQSRNIPVVIGSDAHDPKRVGADFERAFDLLAGVGYESVNFYLERQRQEVSLDAARSSLRQPMTLGSVIGAIAQKFI
jgi:histidinol-phosphatase (PHP family)